MRTIFAKKTDPAAGASPSAPPAPVSVPLYVAGAAAQCAALTVVANQLTNPAFVNLTMALTVLGFAGAFFLRRLGVASGFLRVASFGLAALAFFLLTGRGLVEDVGMTDVRHVSERLLISTLSLVAAIGSFFLVTDEAVAFVGVWGIAIIGLAATTDVNFQLILAFAIFLLAIVFLLVHQHALAQATADQRRALASGRLLGYQAGVAVGLWVVTIFLGVTVSIPLRMVGRNLSLASVVNQLRVAAQNPRQRAAGATGRLSEGGGQFAIGLGPVRDDQTLVMRVWSEQGRYWRGRAYDIYTGHSWMNEQLGAGTEIAPTGREAGDRVFTVPERLDAARKGTKEISYRVQASSPTLSLIYQAGDARQVRVGTEVLSQTADAALSAFNYLSEYRVTSRVVEPDPASLNASPQNYDEALRRRYILTEREPKLVALMEQAVAGKTGPYDRAEAIRQFVANRCVYTLEARRVPDDRDAVEFFLNDSREGYCDLYASAVALLARYAGLPARVATGFSPGETDPDNPGAFLLRESHRHAWPEIYFEGYGWLPFDATQTTQSLDDVLTAPKPKQAGGLLGLLKRLIGGPQLLILAGVVGLVLVARGDRLRRGAGERRVRPEETPEGRRIAALYRSAVRLTQRRGVPRPESMTAREHVAAVRATLGDGAGEALSPLVAVVERLHYTPTRPVAEDVAAARQALRALTDALRGRGR